MIDQTATIEGLALATEAHRRRTTRGPLPSGILEMATRLCRSGHPVDDVARAGRMSVDALERRLSGGSNRVKRRARARARFVSLQQPAPGPLVAPSWIEIERADGAKLRLPGLNPSEALTLFFGSRP